MEENMIQKTGECKYCKQYATRMVPKSFTKEQIDEEVMLHCRCDEAMAEQKVRSMIACTESTIKNFFKEKNLPLYEEVLLSVVEPMARQNMKRITMAAGNFTIAMKRKPESIEVGIKVVNEEKVES